MDFRQDAGNPGMQSRGPHRMSCGRGGAIGRGGDQRGGRARIRTSPRGRYTLWGMHTPRRPIHTRVFPFPPAPATEHGAEQWTMGTP